MTGSRFAPVGSFRDVRAFQFHLQQHDVSIPCDTQILAGGDSPLAQPVRAGRFQIANRFAIQPMEGWDGTPDGRPSEWTIRRWEHFGRSGAGLIWGGEAVAVRHDGRANPNQLMINEQTRAD